MANGMGLVWVGLRIDCIGEQKHLPPPLGSNGGRMEKVHQPEIYELKNSQHFANRE